MRENRRNGWASRSLCDPEVCVLNPPRSEIRKTDDDTEVTFVPMAQVDELTGTMDVSLTRCLGELRKGYSYFRENDVVFAKITPCMENGKSAVARGLKNGIGFGTTEFHILRPGPLALPEWIHLFVRRKDIRGAAKNSMCGAAGQQRVPIDFLQELHIPIPRLEEQRRIVSRIEVLTHRADEARKTTIEREVGLDSLLQALYSQMLEGAEWKPLRKVASLVRRAIKVKPDEEYEEMGIRSFGKGTFKKPALTGRQIGNKRIYQIHQGDLVFNNVFAWEQAIAVAKPEDHGRVGSHRFITYVPHEGQATSEFLCHHFLNERGLEDIRAASPGSAGRNRTLGLTKLEAILVPVPGYDEQKRFAHIAKRRELIRLETSAAERDMKAFTSSVLAKAFRGEL